MTGNPENPERPRIAFYCIYISPPGRSSAKGGAATGPLGDVLLPAAQNSASENGEHFSLSIQIHHQSRNISDTRKNALTWGPRTHQCCHSAVIQNRFGIEGVGLLRRPQLGRIGQLVVEILALSELSGAKDGQRMVGGFSMFQLLLLAHVVFSSVECN